MSKKLRKAPSSSSTVLIVDNDPRTRRVARRLLESHGFRVLDAGDVADAEGIARVYVGPIHLLLVEPEMPKMSGRALADRLGSLHPELRVLFMSRRKRSELVRLGLLDERKLVIRKPLGKRSMAALLRGVA